MEQKVLSIIIVNWNTKDLSIACLRSIYKSTQHLLGSMEVIVVDNGSTDGSVEAIQDNYPGVEVIRLKENIGFTRATNIGLRMCNGEFVLLLNSDTVVEEGAIESMVEFMRKNAECGLLNPLFLNPDGTIQFAGGKQRSLLSITLTLFTGWDTDIYTSLRSNAPIKIKKPYGAALMVRSELLETVGFLDEQFWYGEEDDYGLRAINAGYDIYMLPSAKIVHHGNASGKKNIGVVLANQFLSKVKYYKKHHSIFKMQLLKTIILFNLNLRIFIRKLQLMLTPSNTVYLKEKLDAYREVIQILIKGF